MPQSHSQTPHLDTIVGPAASTLPEVPPQPGLFDHEEFLAEPAARPEPVPDDSPRPAPRINRPQRDQAEMRFESLDQRLELDHPVRVVWSYVLSLDLSELLDNAKAVEGVAGRNISDPRVLFALCLWAAIDGVSSAREIDRLTREHRAYEWLRGDVPLNYHMLAAFRTDHPELLDRLLSEALACLLHEGLIDLAASAQDGMKVRASAGSDSYRRQETLEKHLETAKQRVAELRQQGDDPAIGMKQKAARERGAREKVERLEAALETHKKLAEAREARKKGDGVKTRTSSTDPDAPKMQMPDKGFRPAYNVQLETAVGSGIILGVDVVNQGNDLGQMAPMTEQVKERLGQTPEAKLADGGFAGLDDITATERLGSTVYTPPKEVEKQIAKGKNPYEAKKGDTPEVAAWRQRMGTPEAQAFYKKRGQTAEWVNACLRNWGLYQVRVRGLAKVKTVVMWMVLGHNLLRGLVLRMERAVGAG